MVICTAERISKRYRRTNGEVHALDAATLAVQAGELVAVQGPSGCGKTTLLLALGGLLRPDRGTVTVDGQEIYALTPEAGALVRAHTIGFVFQQFHLIPYLSVLDNILAPSLAMPSPEAKARASELIEHFQLDARRSHFPADLSTGERQRTALARALLNRPKLLLADEPTGNLDTRNAEIVLGYLRKFAQAGGSVLLVTHDDRAVQYAGRVLSMEQGRIREVGAP